MSTTYNVVAGDTFDLISRKSYGTEIYESNIANANPGVVEPLTPGTSIILPDIPGLPQDTVADVSADESNEVAISIDGVRFRFWDSVAITRALDVLDVVEFGAPFEPELQNFRQTFRPFSYKDVNITVGGSRLFTGTMLTPTPVLSNDKKTVNVSCYSKPGVLNDCNAPASIIEELQFSGVNLQGIAEQLAAPFGIGVEFAAEAGDEFGGFGSPFDRLAIGTDEKILAFLSKLALERNFVITNNEAGDLLFQRSVQTGNPVAVLEQGASPVLSVTPAFSPQEYYSHITGIEPVLFGLAGSQYTVKNPRLNGVLRPISFTIPDVLETVAQTAAEAKAGRMFANTVTYSVEVDTWRTPSGELWKPNTAVVLIAPSAMVYNRYEFIIRGVKLVRDSRSEKATLDLVLPGSFSGEIPETLPWDE